MKRQLFTQLLVALSLCTSIACNKLIESGPIVTTGMRPIYANAQSVRDIRSQAPQPIQSLGKIYYYNQMLFVNEVNKGIHVIDNHNPLNPVITHFIAIPGNNDMAIRGNYMYVDNFTDLVTLDITDLNNVTVTKRIADVYHIGSTFYPSNYNGYFECVDESKGFVIGWESATLTDPKCYR